LEGNKGEGGAEGAEGVEEQRRPCTTVPVVRSHTSQLTTRDFCPASSAANCAGGGDFMTELRPVRRLHSPIPRGRPSPTLQKKNFSAPQASSSSGAASVRPRQGKAATNACKCAGLSCQRSRPRIEPAAHARTPMDALHAPRWPLLRCKIMRPPSPAPDQHARQGPSTSWSSHLSLATLRRWVGLGPFGGW